MALSDLIKAAQEGQEEEKKQQQSPLGKLESILAAGREPLSAPPKDRTEEGKFSELDVPRHLQKLVRTDPAVAIQSVDDIEPPEIELPRPQVEQKPKPRTSTAGQIAINYPLPPELRDYSRELTRKEVEQIFSRISDPDKFRQVANYYVRLGAIGSTYYSPTVRIQDVLPSQKERQERDRVRKQAIDLLRRGDREGAMRVVNEFMSRYQVPEDSSFAQMSRAGYSMANEAKAARVGPGILEDSMGNPVPFPVLHSYPEGLSPAEYLVGTFGSRRAIVATKLDIRDAGYLAKRLLRLAHRAVVTRTDNEGDEDPNPKLPRTLRALPVDIDDEDIEGYLLARETAGYPANTVITPALIKELRKKGVKKLLVRNPIAAPGGLYKGFAARDVGLDEKGNLPGRGYFAGIVAAQALGEPAAQLTLLSKHTAGEVGSGMTGYRWINSLIEQPVKSPDKAIHSSVEGIVREVKDRGEEGVEVTIGGEKLVLPPRSRVKVKKGDKIRVGDQLTEGIPDIAFLVKSRGLGEARRIFSEELRRAYAESGLPISRRNTDLIASALLDYVRLTEDSDLGNEGDVVFYSEIESSYEPREDAKWTPPRSAVGRYLEAPVLHYTIGTKVDEQVAKELAEHGIDKVLVHKKPPPFEPVFVRASDVLSHDPDWIVKTYGEDVKRSILSSLRSQYHSIPEEGTSWVPYYAKGRRPAVRMPEEKRKRQ